MSVWLTWTYALRVMSHLKQELAWDADKWLQVISTMIYIKNSWSIKELKGSKE